MYVQGVVPKDVHLMPGQVKDVHDAISEFSKRPPPLPNGRGVGGGGGRVQSNGTTKSRDSQGLDDLHSSGSSPSFRDDISENGSLRGPQMAPGTYPMNSQSFGADSSRQTDNLRSLARRQDELASKMLSSDGAGDGGRRASNQMTLPPESRYDGRRDDYGRRGGQQQREAEQFRTQDRTASRHSYADNRDRLQSYDRSYENSRDELLRDRTSGRPDRSYDSGRRESMGGYDRANDYHGGGYREGGGGGYSDRRSEKKDEQRRTSPRLSRASYSDRTVERNSSLNDRVDGQVRVTILLDDVETRLLKKGRQTLNTRRVQTKLVRIAIIGYEVCFCYFHY